MPRSMKCETQSDKNKERRGEAGRQPAVQPFLPTAEPHAVSYQEPQKGFSRLAIGSSFISDR